MVYDTKHYGCGSFYCLCMIVCTKIQKYTSSVLLPSSTCLRHYDLNFRQDASDARDAAQQRLMDAWSETFGNSLGTAVCVCFFVV